MIVVINSVVEKGLIVSGGWYKAKGDGAGFLSRCCPGTPGPAQRIRGAGLDTSQRPELTALLGGGPVPVIGKRVMLIKSS